MENFRVFDLENQNMPFMSQSLEDVIDFLQPYWNNPNRSLYDFGIDDTYNDIEVNWLDLMEYVDKGYIPTDLTIF